MVGTMSLKFFWYAPTHGDSRYIATGAPEFPGTPDYIAKIAKAAEATGFDGILVPAGPGCSDAFVTATHIASVTTRLRPLIAVRTGSMLPTVVAKMAATLDQISGGRVYLNIVTGGSPLELAMDGDFVEHDSRYARTEEFLQVLSGVWDQDCFSYTGKFFNVRDARFKPVPVQKPRPRLYLGGASEAAIDAAVRFADTYLMWGEPVEEVQDHLAKARARANQIGRNVRFGMRITLIVSVESSSAWERAEEMLSHVDSDAVVKLNKYLSNSDSVGQKKIQSLRHRTTSDPCFWTGMVPYRTGNSTALVGSVFDVAKSLKRYVEAGISEFIFSSYPHDDTTTIVGEGLLPLVRRLTDQQELHARSLTEMHH
jgi:alkanesulfonate monooxygenase